MTDHVDTGFSAFLGVSAEPPGQTPAALIGSPGCLPGFELLGRAESSAREPGELRPRGNMPANQSSPQWSSVLAAEGHGSLCEVRRERTPGARVHPVRRQP